MSVTVEVNVAFDAVNILFNGALHLHLTRSKLLGVQSWAYEKRGCYVVEFVMEGATFQSEYDDRKKWLDVLDGLKRVL